MSVAESKTNALFDQGFVQTGVMLRKEDKACIVTDMGRVEWFQVNPWGGVQALSAAPAGPWSLGEMTGNWRDIDLPDHGAVMRIVWKMEDDDGRNEKLEAQAHAVVAALNAASPTPPAEARRRYDATAEQAAPKAAPVDALDEAMRERDDAEDFIDALLDEVLGHEHPEWSNLYGRADALNDVQERMAALHKPAVDKACGQFQSAMAAPQQEAQEPTEIPEEIERMATDRYKVVPSHESMFHRWAVVAGSGTQQLYLGREVECQNMARKFAGAFLDGAFFAMQQPAPQQEAQDATVAAFEAVRKKLCTLPRYSFVLDDDGLVRRAPDRTGNWIEFDEAHALFDPLSVDAAIAAQGGKA